MATSERQTNLRSQKVFSKSKNSVYDNKQDLCVIAVALYFYEMLHWAITNGRLVLIILSLRPDEHRAQLNDPV